MLILCWCWYCVIESLLWAGASQWRIYYHRMWVQLSTTWSNVLKQPNGEHLVAVNHNQLRTMASETVDPIDWSYPPPSCGVLPERHVHSINQCNLSGTRTCNRCMRGNHLDYAAARGIISIGVGVVVVLVLVLCWCWYICVGIYSRPSVDYWLSDLKFRKELFAYLFNFFFCIKIVFLCIKSKV